MFSLKDERFLLQKIPAVIQIEEDRRKRRGGIQNLNILLFLPAEFFLQGGVIRSNLEDLEKLLEEGEKNNMKLVLQKYYI